MSTLKNIVEALLLSSHEPITLEKIREILTAPLPLYPVVKPREFGTFDIKTLQTIIDALKDDYSTRSFELIQVASGYQIQTRSEYSAWVSALHSEKPAKYSRALLETLAIIAYKQPVTRADIEEIRGVAVSSYIIKTLMEREWIRIAGYKDVPGKPAVYTTTKEFLNYHNLNHLHELPALIMPEDASKTNEECII